MKNQFVQTALLCGSSLLLVGAKAAVAHGNSDQNHKMDDFVVVGNHQAYKGEFTALETPQAELTIDQQVIEDAGAIDLNQALDLSASVARQNNFGGLWNSFAVRGFVGDENLPSNYLVNGFNAGRGFGGPRDLSGIESVEVLKGPRAALFGRGEPGGTINLVTKRPTFEDKGEIRVSAGSYDTYRTDFDWTGAVSDDVAIRLVGFYEDAKSFRDTVETEKHGLNPSITYLIDEDTQLTYELEYSNQEIPFDRGVVAINGQLGVLPRDRFLGEPSYGPIETEVVGHQLELQHDINDNWRALVGFNYRDTSLEGWASENEFAGPAANGDFDRFTRFRDYEAEYKVLRAELSGNFDTGNIEHRVIVGVDADKFKNDQFALRDRTSPQLINVYNPVYGNAPLSGLNNLAVQVNRVQIQESVGVYFQDHMSLTDQLDVRVGVRYDDYEQELFNRKESSLERYTKRGFSPQFGAVYKVNDAFSLYAAYGENFRPLTGASENNGLESNESESKEIGVNFSLNDGALEGSFSIFELEQSNIRTASVGGEPTAIGGAESKGVELDIYGQLTDSLSLWLSYSYIEAKTQSAFNEPNFGAEVPAGADLLNIPENQLSLQLVKQTKLAGKDLRLIGGALYVGSRNGFFANQNFKLPSYVTARVAANYELSKSVELRAEINNLFDEEYYSNSFSDTWVQPGAPRNANVSATFRF